MLTLRHLELLVTLTYVFVDAADPEEKSSSSGPPPCSDTASKIPVLIIQCSTTGPLKLEDLIQLFLSHYVKTYCTVLLM